MGKIKTWFRQLFCRHWFRINRWHWCHGPTGNNPLMIEYERICPLCGKLTYGVVDDRLKDAFAEFHRDKEWR